MMLINVQRGSEIGDLGATPSPSSQDKSDHGTQGFILVGTTCELEGVLQKYIRADIANGTTGMSA